MKTIIKKIFITYLVIISCIYTPTAQAANWSFGGYNFGNGSLNIVKDGVKITTAAVDSAPITSNLGSKILSGAIRGASVLSAISIIAGIAESAIDWVLDPANNAVKYRTKTTTGGNFSHPAVGSYDTADGLLRALQASFGSNEYARYEIVGDRYYMYKADGTSQGYVIVTLQKESYTPYSSVSVPRVASEIFSIAKSGNTSAQADVTAAVTELVNTGAYDTPINQAIQDAENNGTIPKDDTANPPTTPTTPQIDTSSITAAIQSLASAFASAISNAFNGITSVINTSIDKLLNKQDQIQGELVNTGSKIDAVGGQVVGVGDKVDNVGGKVVGVGDAVKDVGGKVVGLNDSVDKVGDKVVGVGDKVDAAGDKVTDAVTGVGDKVGSKVDSVGEKVTTVGDKVTGVGDKVDAAGDKVGSKVDSVGEKVTTVGDKVTGVGDKVDAASDKVADAVKESTKEITDKMEQTKPKDFELPAFCSWASKVCDFIDWVKESPPEELPPQQVKNGTLQDIDLDTFDRYQKRIYFPPHCPSKTFELSVLGVHIVKPVDFSGLCSVLEAITPWLLAATYISCAFFVIREI